MPDPVLHKIELRQRMHIVKPRGEVQVPFLLVGLRAFGIVATQGTGIYAKPERKTVIGCIPEKEACRRVIGRKMPPGINVPYIIGGTSKKPQFPLSEGPFFGLGEAVAHQGNKNEYQAFS